MDELLTIGPMARRVGVTVGWLRDEADAGRVPCLRAGERRLFNPEAVRRVLAERAALPASVSAEIARVPA
jgi:hypothetical protein